MPRNFQTQKSIFKIFEKLFCETDNQLITDKYPFGGAIDTIYIIFRFATMGIYMCMAE